MNFLFLKSTRELEIERNQRILYEDDLRATGESKSKTIAKSKRRAATKKTVQKSKRRKAAKRKN